jgi:hypothetical protein
MHRKTARRQLGLFTTERYRVPSERELVQRLRKLHSQMQHRCPVFLIPSPRHREFILYAHQRPPEAGLHFEPIPPSTEPFRDAVKVARRLLFFRKTTFI